MEKDKVFIGALAKIYAEVQALRFHLLLVHGSIDPGAGEYFDKKLDEIREAAFENFLTVMIRSTDDVGAEDSEKALKADVKQVFDQLPPLNMN